MSVTLYASQENIALSGTFITRILLRPKSALRLMLDARYYKLWFTR